VINQAGETTEEVGSIMWKSLCGVVMAVGLTACGGGGGSIADQVRAAVNTDERISEEFRLELAKDSDATVETGVEELCRTVEALNPESIEEPDTPEEVMMMIVIEIACPELIEGLPAK
jgi:hypothetical protein